MKKIPQEIKFYLDKVKLPAPDSHKGQNGKLLIIGGSELFHAASKWSLDVASKFVDMVFYSSVPINNQLVREAKANFWNGIVVPRAELEAYLTEADCILLGPGMERVEETAQLTTKLLEEYGHKKWVIDAGALQMLKPHLLQSHHILTPHHQELTKLMEIEQKPSSEAICSWLRQVNQPTLLLKGPIDQVFLSSSQLDENDRFEKVQKKGIIKVVEVEGGNVGLTKGGTGDVLAGLVAALYCTQDQAVSTIVGSYVNKCAGDELYREVGPFYNASDLVDRVPKVMWSLLSSL